MLLLMLLSNAKTVVGRSTFVSEYIENRGKEGLKERLSLGPAGHELQQPGTRPTELKSNNEMAEEFRDFATLYFVQRQVVYIISVL
ncbi:uncharacterized protein BDR25DRAFT_357427 [Lindgomyces ingoldianus]|uniref:Uncharacterized protein n=1 Tax=Lindgomyces ingoldianus TaxID=673940 RepID=A0ACB6QNP1_9PLEO|nr:uncharacterized protein BDR25DRAFT_357427 [Lindgomyces ingoldianus]KAF2468495.1 hypothetical protein BDR25DRAFT_357427 [Lindgomyces ingoldianus]